MKRAAVLIGVDKTGGLPRLADAAAGAERMEAWALAQGLRREDVVLLTDRAGPVTLDAITDAVAALVDKGSVEQLVVYFAGHGVMIRRGEYWLLSKAPLRPNEAVNVEGSVALARTCGIPHVVFISDACRTAAAGVQAQSVTGGEIFTNEVDGRPGRPVDWFFATTVGKPALELRADGSADGDFRAVYTAALIDAVSGRLPSALAPGAAGEKPAFVVRPWALLDTLTAELPKRIDALGLGSRVTQEPDARINSRPDSAWVAGFDADPRAAVASAASPPEPSPTRGSPSLRAAAAPPTASRAMAPSAVPAPGPAAAALASRRDLAAAVRDAVLQPFEAPVSAPVSASPTAAFRRTRGAAPSPPTPPSPAAALPPPSAPLRVEVGRGIRLRGATVARATATAGLACEVLGDARESVRIGPHDGRSGLVLLEFAESGTGVLLPSFAGWNVAVEVAENEVVDVSWEPAENTPIPAEPALRADGVRALRGRVADAAREGVFRLDAKTAAGLAPWLQGGRGIDPGLALYAAYAYHAIQDEPAIARMADALRAEHGIVFFDLLLLARRLKGVPPGDALPPFPLLQQGWNLPGALGAALPGTLAPLRGELVDALWTQFTPAGVARLQRLIDTKALP